MAVISTYRIGKHFFMFKFYPVGGYYDIDILKSPSYGKRKPNGVYTMRIPSQRGGMKICFAIPEVIDTLDKADKWSKAWAKLTSAYILTGKKFPKEKSQSL